MSLKAKAQSGKDFNVELPPDGQHIAVCVAVIDLGTHAESYQNEPPEDVHKLLMVWELVGEVTRPVVGMDFRVSLHVKSKLRTTIKSWFGGKDIPDGQEFDPRLLLGKACQLTIEHKTGKEDRKYAKVINVSALAKGMTAPAAEKKPFAWDMDVEGAGNKSPSLPEWVPFLYGRSIEDWILTSHERKGKAPADKPADEQAPAGVGSRDDGRDDAPF